MYVFVFTLFSYFGLNLIDLELDIKRRLLGLSPLTSFHPPLCHLRQIQWDGGEPHTAFFVTRWKQWNKLTPLETI